MLIRALRTFLEERIEFLEFRFFEIWALEFSGPSAHFFQGPIQGPDGAPSGPIQGPDGAPPGPIQGPGHTPPDTDTDTDELSGPNQGPLPTRPGKKYVAQGTLAATFYHLPLRKV